MPGNQENAQERCEKEAEQHTKPHHAPEGDDDYVPPRDRADELAREYEEGHHERAGAKARNETPSHQGKPKSVRP